MIQVVFFAVLVIAMLGGFFAYYAPSHQGSPMKFVMDSTGYNSTESSNQKKIQQLNTITSKGLMQIRGQMDDITIKKNEFMDTVRDQQQILKEVDKNIQGVLLDAKKQGKNNDKDFLQLEALGSDIQDEGRLLVSRGQYIIALNNQLIKNRQLIAEESDLSNINTESSLNALHQRYALLSNQANGVLARINQHNQEVSDQMDRICAKLSGMAYNPYGNAAKLQRIRDRIEQMLDNEHEAMIRKDEIKEKNREHLEDIKEKAANAKEKMDDAIQRTEDLIEHEHQKQEDQQSASQQ